MFTLLEPLPERILWCNGQLQPLYDDFRKILTWIEFVKGTPDYLNGKSYIDANKKNHVVFDDLMTEAKCDQRIPDLFTRGSHHMNLSVVYLRQNLFPQGKACRHISLNTQYVFHFNNPIYRQQVATLARRIYPSTSAIFMKRFEQTTSRPNGVLIIDLQSATNEKDRLHTDIFDRFSSEEEKLAVDEESANA